MANGMRPERFRMVALKRFNGRTNRDCKRNGSIYEEQNKPIGDNGRSFAERERGELQSS